MKKIILTILLVINLQAQIIEVTKDCVLVGAIKDINTADFENTCLDYVWAYKDNKWYLFSNKTVTIDHEPLFEILSGDGFWVKGSYNCIVEFNHDALNIDIKTDEAMNKIYIVDNDEYYKDDFLNIVNAKYAYTNNITGKGVTVALMDTGIDINHSDLNMNIKYVDTKLGTNGIDDRGHGTHVAGIIASEYNDNEIHGVAYNADLISIKVADTGGASLSLVGSGLVDAVDSYNAKVANLSLGGAKATDNYISSWIDDFKYALDNDLSLIIASGNDSLDNPFYPGNLPSLDKYKELTSKVGAFMVVGAVDSSNNIAHYSNKAGNSKDWFIVAPGTIYSTYLKNQYTTMSGTSMATTVVTGAFALISELRPDLTGNQIANVLFETATDLGEAGVDEIYGHGLLNIENAIKYVESL